MGASARVDLSQQVASSIDSFLAGFGLLNATAASSFQLGHGIRHFNSRTGVCVCGHMWDDGCAGTFLRCFSPS